jgi:hypothetical protein
MNHSLVAVANHLDEASRLFSSGQIAQACSQLDQAGSILHELITVQAGAKPALLKETPRREPQPAPAPRALAMTA